MDDTHQKETYKFMDVPPFRKQRPPKMFQEQVTSFLPPPLFLLGSR